MGTFPSCCLRAARLFSRPCGWGGVAGGVFPVVCFTLPAPPPPPPFLGFGGYRDPVIILAPASGLCRPREENRCGKAADIPPKSTLTCSLVGVMLSCSLARVLAASLVCCSLAFCRKARSLVAFSGGLFTQPRWWCCSLVASRSLSLSLSFFLSMLKSTLACSLAVVLLTCSFVEILPKAR